MQQDFVYEIRGFGGLSQGSEGASAKSGESPDTVNFSLTSDRRLKKREGFRTVGQFRDRIRAIWSGILADRRHCFVVESTKVWHGEGDFASMEQVGMIPGQEGVQIVEFAGALYFLSGMGMRCFSPAEGFGEVKPYRPLLMAGSGPDGLGTPVEEANLLGGLCRQQFTPAQGEAVYHLCLTELDSVDYVSLNGRELASSQYTVNLQGGLVTLELGGGAEDSLEIGFTKHNADNERRVTRCRFASVFGGNNETALFLWGNKDYPAMRLHSGYADGVSSGAYFPETHYVQVGDGSAVTGMVRFYDRQLIFTAESAFLSESETATDEFGRRRTYYPVKLISSAAGNLSVGNACLAGNTPVSVTAGGLCRWQNNSLRDETNATVFSHRISRGLGEMELSSLRLFYSPSGQRLYAWNPKGSIYVYDALTDSFWRCEGWEPNCFFEETDTGRLYFATEDGRVCQVGGTSDDGKPIEAYWYSEELDPGAPFRTKTLFGVSAGVKANSRNALELEWSADVEGESLPNSGKLRREASRRLCDFGSWCFERLSFLTGYHARNLTFRLRVRRFRRIRLCLRERSEQDLQVESIRLWGRIHEKRR